MESGMNDNDREKLAELIAIKVSEKYFLIMKEYIANEIRLHKAECTVGKSTKVMGFICAVFGGIFAAFLNWLLRKL